MKRSSCEYRGCGLSTSFKLSKVLRASLCPKAAPSPEKTCAVCRLISCRSFLARAALAALAGLASQNRVIGLSTRLGSGRCGLQGLPAREKAVGGWQNSAPRDFAERNIMESLAESKISPP